MKVQLLAKHVIGDVLHEVGTVIGDGTPYPIPGGFEPTPDMVPLDKEAEKKIGELFERLYGKDGPKVMEGMVAHEAATERPGFLAKEAPKMPEPPHPGKR